VDSLVFNLGENIVSKGVNGELKNWQKNAFFEKNKKNFFLKAQVSGVWY
jgi:hypothetical protein